MMDMWLAFVAGLIVSTLAWTVASDLVRLWTVLLIFAASSATAAYVILSVVYWAVTR